MVRLFIFLLGLSLQVQAQDTTYVRPLVTTAGNSPYSNERLTGSTDASYGQPLLPHKMLFTQRIFWGPNGLLRVVNVAPLTAEGREKEQKVRRFMLVAHQVTGYVTVAGFVVQGILGARLNNATGADYSRLYHAQQMTAAVTNVAYGTTAILSLTAPPKLVAEQKGASRLRLHKYLALAHLTGFVATNILAGKAAQNSEFRPYHQVASWTTLAAFAPALITLKF